MMLYPDDDLSNCDWVMARPFCQHRCDSPGSCFFRLWRASHVRAADVLGLVGLTPALFALLNVIGAREGAIQQELGSALGIDRSTMVSLIDQLESAGLAKRRRRHGPPSPGD